jgi:putative FmdB family regulatory protein
MPLYEYKCDACGHRFERIQKFSDPPVDVCPNCGELKVQKLLSSPAIQFKGTGWYITDYAKRGEAGAEAKTSAPADAAKETKGASASKESKESKSSAAASGTTAAPKASGE